MLSEPLLNEPCDRFHSPFNRRRFGVAMVSHGLRLVILADTVDDDAPDVDAEHFRLVHAHLSNAYHNPRRLSAAKPSSGSSWC